MSSNLKNNNYGVGLTVRKA